MFRIIVYHNSYHYCTLEERELHTPVSELVLVNPWHNFSRRLGNTQRPHKKSLVCKHVVKHVRSVLCSRRDFSWSARTRTCSICCAVWRSRRLSSSSTTNPGSRRLPDLCTRCVDVLLLSSTIINIQPLSPLLVDVNPLTLTVVIMGKVTERLWHPGTLTLSPER